MNILTFLKGARIQEYMVAALGSTDKTLIMHNIDKRKNNSGQAPSTGVEFSSPSLVSIFWKYTMEGLWWQAETDITICESGTSLQQMKPLITNTRKSTRQKRKTRRKLEKYWCITRCCFFTIWNETSLLIPGTWVIT